MGFRGAQCLCQQIEHQNCEQGQDGAANACTGGIPDPVAQEMYRCSTER